MYTYETERDRSKVRGAAGKGDVVYLARSRAAPSGPLRLRHVSPWHDVPLRPHARMPMVINMVCEVPRGTRAKYEVTVDEEPLNPIRRDLTSDGRPRSYPSRMPWNYGMVPRTWEDPSKRTRVSRWIPGQPPRGTPSFLAPGDGDPLDVVEIGSSRCEVGGVYPVVALGALALLDGGELDWKVIAIRTDDPLLASGRFDLLPDIVDRIRHWFVDYKPGSGNGYAFGGSLMPAAAVIRAAHAGYVSRRRRALSI